MPPMTSTIRSAPSRILSKSPSLRRSTPVISGRIPVIASICPARCGSSSANAPPTVPRPSRPMRKGSDIAVVELLGGLATHDKAGVAVGGEDDRSARDTVVGVGHGEAVAAGGGRDDHVANLRLGQVRILHDHVAGFAVLAHELARAAAGGGLR